MDRKTLIWIGIALGGTLGSYIPVMFGADPFSFPALLLGAVGSILGIWIAYKMSA